MAEATVAVAAEPPVRRGGPPPLQAEPKASPAQTDEALVRRVCGGDEEAFEALYERYFARVFQFVARRIRNRADAEETVQEVFVNLFGSIGSFRGDAPFGAWVFGLTRRTVASRFKRKRLAFVPFEGEDGDVPVLPADTPRPPGPHEMYEYRERLGRLEHALHRVLSEEQRQLFALHHLERLPIQEIAERLGKTQHAVKSHLYRARKLLLAR